MEMSFLYAIPRTSLLDTFFLILNKITGSYGQIWVFLAVLLLVFKKTRKTGIAVLITYVAVFLLGQLTLKHLISRPRPCQIDQTFALLLERPSSSSFPSTHAAWAFGAATAIFMRYRKAGAAALIAAALIAFSRLYLFMHFPTDVLFGTAMGIVLGIVAYRITERMKDRRENHFIINNYQVRKRVIEMKKKTWIMILVVIAVAATAAGILFLNLPESRLVLENGDDEQTLNVAFSYEHDPRENPEAMKDIVENPDAVYGFSPSPDSERLKEYAEYDWTDPEFVAQAMDERRAYHESMDSMTDILYEMRSDGATIEEMARAVSEERNRIRLASYADDPDGLEKLKQSNLETYGHEEGPTPDELFEKYGNWQTVLQKAFSANMGMDACCGLYDEYYRLYIELGYVE